MLRKILISGLAILMAGCAFEMDTAMEQDFEPGETDTSTWVSRQKSAPQTPAEVLAGKVLKNDGKPQKSGNFSAWLMNDDPPFATVAVDEQLPNEGTVVRVLYRFEEDTVIAASYPEYVDALPSEEDKNKREQYAREVAIQAKERTAPSRPVLYEGKYAYSPKFDGNCRVIVTEYNTTRKILGTYVISVCQDERQ